MPGAKSIEARMVFLLAGGPQAAPALARLAGPLVDWDRFVRIAIAERAAGEVVAAARRDPSLFPESVVARLRPSAMVLEFRQRTLEQRLLESVDALDRAGIPVVLLKGAALAVSVYGGFAARPMDDLDLLIEPEDATRAREALEQVGWFWDRDFYPESRYVSHQHRPPLVDRRGTDATIELHTRLFAEGHPFAFESSLVRRRSIGVDFAGRTLRIPEPSHHLVHAALHFTWGHTCAFGARRTARDIAVLAESGRVDWGLVEAIASASGAATGVHWALRLARSLANAPVPEDVVARLAPRISPRVDALVERHLVHLALRDAAACPSTRVRRLMWDVAMQPARSGHGDVRPWTGEFDIRHNVEGELRPPPVSTPARVVSHLRQLQRWGHYFAAVLGPAVSTLASPILFE